MYSDRTRQNVYQYAALSRYPTKVTDGYNSEQNHEYASPPFKSTFRDELSRNQVLGGEPCCAASRAVLASAVTAPRHCTAAYHHSPAHLVLFAGILHFLNAGRHLHNALACHCSPVEAKP